MEQKNWRMVELMSSLLRTFKQTRSTSEVVTPAREPPIAVPTVELSTMEGGRSRHSPRSMEAAKTTVVVTMVTSKLSRTLKKAVRLTLRLEVGCGSPVGSRGHLMNLALGWMCLIRYLAKALLMQLKSAPRRPPATPIMMKKARSTAVHR